MGHLLIWVLSIMAPFTLLRDMAGWYLHALIHDGKEGSARELLIFSGRVTVSHMLLFLLRDGVRTPLSYSNPSKRPSREPSQWRLIRCFCQSNIYRAWKDRLSIWSLGFVGGGEDEISLI